MGSVKWAWGLGEGLRELAIRFGCTNLVLYKRGLIPTTVTSIQELESYCNYDIPKIVFYK